MTKPDFTRRTVAIAGLGAILASGGCAMMEPAGSRFSPMPPGSTFTRVEQNTGSLGNGKRELKVAVSEERWNDVDVISYKSPVGAQVVRRDGRLIAFLDPAGKTALKWDPVDQAPGMRFPLSVGKTWTESSKMTNARNEVIPHENTCRVEAEEEVKVTAGTFKTFKVHCSSPRGLEITSWYAPALGIDVKQSWRRSAGNPFGGAGTRDLELVAVELNR